MPADHYCLIADVNALAVQVAFTTTSKPTDTQVTTLIESVAKRMDASMANIGYVVPVVSGTNALALLREACAWGAMGLAQQIRDSGVSTAVNASMREGKNIWSQMFDEWIAKLCDPQDPFELSDAPRTNEQLVKQPDQVLRSFVQTMPADDPSYDPDAPVITRYQTL